jgi:hypothetical protein
VAVAGCLLGSLLIGLRRLVAVDATGTAEQKIALLQKQIDAYRKLSTSLAYDNA